jgi:FkbM family methyltransferase
MHLNHETLYAAALAHRSTLPNGPMFSISDLLNLPKFYNWVDCFVTKELNFQMYLAGADDGVALRFFWNGCYEKTTIGLWSHFVKHGGVIIDIGAHTGAYTLAAFSADPNASILSFEPHFMNFSRLNMNLRGNGCDPKNIFMLGVGEKNEILPFSTPFNTSYLTSGGSIGAKDNTLITDIQVVGLDEFIPQSIRSEVRLIKIDVEGHEDACLRGMHRLIFESQPIIFLECIHGASGLAVSKTLKELNYVFYVINDDTGEIYQVDNILPETDDSGNIVRSKLNRIATHKDFSLRDELRS